MSVNAGISADPYLRDPKKTAAPNKWAWCLYMTRQKSRCQQAVHNLRKLWEQHLTGKYIIEIIDLLVNLKLARDGQIVATPKVVRRLPLPVRRVVGGLSKSERVLVGLNLWAHAQIP